MHQTTLKINQENRSFSHIFLHFEVDHTETEHFISEAEHIESDNQTLLQFLIYIFFKTKHTGNFFLFKCRI